MCKIGDKVEVVELTGSGPLAREVLSRLGRIGEVANVPPDADGHRAFVRFPKTGEHDEECVELPTVALRVL